MGSDFCPSYKQELDPVPRMQAIPLFFPSVATMLPQAGRYVLQFSLPGKRDKRFFITSETSSFTMPAP